jgi:error-prone DNA polymerase
VAERERGGFGSVEDLTARCSTRVDSLERLAWAGALDGLVSGGRREALWRLGVAAPGVSVPDGTQLAMPVDVDSPELDALGPWDRLVADYGSTNMTLGDHPIGLMRPLLADDVLSSKSIERARDGERVRVAGMVVARQRPATAKGITFMLLEDEFGTINLIVPVPVYEMCRLAVRSEPLLIADGKLEHREGTINVLVSDVRRLERPDLPVGEVRHIEPRRIWSNDESGDALRDDGDLRAVMPVAHSFGRR